MDEKALIADTPETALAAAIKEAGGPKAVAEHFGITQQAVGQWRRCPPTRVIDLERLAKGAVSRSQLRPDIFPASQAAA